MKLSFILILFFPLPILGQNPIGKYRYLDKFEKVSEIELFKNGKFNYNCHLGGCQTEITGFYIIKDNKIKFKNDEKYTNEFLKRESDSLIAIDSTLKNFGTPYYPDMSKVDWKLKSNCIKPLKKIDCGCFWSKNNYVKL